MISHRADDEMAFVPTPVYSWPDLAPGTVVAGPALIASGDTTVVVPPDRHATIDGWRNVVLVAD